MAGQGLSRLTWPAESNLHLKLLETEELPIRDIEGRKFRTILPPPGIDAVLEDVSC
jgi:hypothetical protein